MPSVIPGSVSITENPAWKKSKVDSGLVGKSGQWGA